MTTQRDGSSTKASESSAARRKARGAKRGILPRSHGGILDRLGVGRGPRMWIGGTPEFDERTGQYRRGMAGKSGDETGADE
jgi:hypothetical protein